MCHSDGVSAILYILERKVCPEHSTLMEFVGKCGIHFFLMFRTMPKKESVVNGFFKLNFYFFYADRTPETIAN